MTSLQSFVMGDVLFLTGLTLLFVIAYWVGRADILRRIWRRVSGRERVKYTFTLEFEKYVSEGEPYPRGYGFAFYDGRTDTKIAYPVPLNVVARGVRCIYLWYLEWFVSAIRGRSKWDLMLMDARRYGRIAGQVEAEKRLYKNVKSGAYNEGYEKGHNDGFADGRTILISDLTKEIEQILAKDVDAKPETIHATLVNNIRADEKRKAKTQGYVEGYFDRKRFFK